MSSRKKPHVIHIGGCISASGPEDRVDFCNCYHLRFTICVRFKVYRVVMCRDWVHYVAGSIIDPTRNGIKSGATGSVIEKEIRHHFGIKLSHWWSTPGNRIPRCAKGKKLCDPLGHYPDYFREVVMSNKYGHIYNCIPCAEILAQDELDTDQYNAPDDYDHREMWMRNSRDSENISYNKGKYRSFLKVLSQIASDRVYRWKVDAEMNREDVAIKLLKLKIKDHATDEQQVTASLPV